MVYSKIAVPNASLCGNMEARLGWENPAPVSVSKTMVLLRKGDVSQLGQHVGARHHRQRSQAIYKHWRRDFLAQFED
jgi:hypothetical protein